MLINAIMANSVFTVKIHAQTILTADNLSPMRNNTLMVQGTSSDAGKSIVTAGICRLLKRKNIKVAPFKPQNMALNSAVTPEGGEIGRAQALQALACGIAPHTDMNPILLKPSSDVGAQVIIHGKPLQNMDAETYHNYKARAMDFVLESHQRLEKHYHAIIVEGAGSPAEINLRDNDIANMGFAEAVDCPVILVADIDRGGVFAQLVGTLALLSETEKNRVIGFVINRFRGDLALLKPGLDWLEKYTSKPVIGVLPYLQNFQLEAEDAIDIKQTTNVETKITICVLVFSRISNHTDFDSLRANPQVNLSYVAPGEAIPDCDLIILPGSKNVRQDLADAIKHRWNEQVLKHLRYGGKVIGICGGYQMLGHAIHDPLGIEGKPGTSQGLALIDIETTLEPEKVLTHNTGTTSFDSAKVGGYQIHSGISRGDGLDKPALYLDDQPEGVISPDNNILGTYLHGLFDLASAQKSLLNWAGAENISGLDHLDRQEAELDRLADTMEHHLNMDKIYQYINR